MTGRKIIMSKQARAQGLTRAARRAMGAAGTGFKLSAAEPNRSRKGRRRAKS